MKSKKCSSNQDVPFERYAVQAGVRINLNTPWEEVLHLAVRSEVSKGNVIQLTREMEEDFYYLSQGSICLQILTSNGRENTSNHVHKGCLFNWVKNRINDLPVLFSVGASSLYNKDESWNEAVGACGEEHAEKQGGFPPAGSFAGRVVHRGEDREESCLQRFTPALAEQGVISCLVQAGLHAETNVEGSREALSCRSVQRKGLCRELDSGGAVLIFLTPAILNL